ncbi:MAG: GTPase Era [Gemmatimonadetes bacterium]|nr:GTPase Era [Gemmatimonadota bacterium]
MTFEKAELSPDFRAGYAALAGRPNVGKSALLNAWMGVHLSIVSPKPQTTRERVLGICTRPGGQVVFVDMPGLVEPKHKLHESMLLEAREGLQDADVVLFVSDAADPKSYADGELLKDLPHKSAPLLVVVNKIDLVDGPLREALAQRFEPLGEVWLVSATRGDNLEPLLAHVLELLPVSPPLYPPDDLAVQPVRFFVQEYIRETCLELFHEEIPHSIACRVEEFHEDRDPVYIQATVFVERPSQKRIVVGSGGVAIRRVGTVARRKIESLVQRPVYLDLWVKVLPGWRRNPHRLRSLGYRLRRRGG